jgi:hypothetical protein
MLSKVVDLRERMAEKLDGKITMTKRVLAFSFIFILLLFGSLSGVSPFWLRRLLRLNTNVVWIPDDPENKQRWALHSVAQDEALFHMKCAELQERGVILPPKAAPRRRGTRRPKR